MNFLAVDPGLSGAMCIIRDNGTKEIVPMPIGKGYPEPVLTVNIIKRLVGHEKFVAAIERIGTRPGQGIGPAQRYGIGAGVLIGAVHALGAQSVHIVDPKTWQLWIWKHYNSCGDDTKIRTLQAVSCAHPELVPVLTTIKGKLLDGNSDALGICTFIKNFHEKGAA
jgi:hypothetical protein